MKRTDKESLASNPVKDPNQYPNSNFLSYFKHPGMVQIIIVLVKNQYYLIKIYTRPKIR